jgi:hypothetical protein
MWDTGFIIIITLLTYLLTYLLTAIELSLSGSSPYTSRDKTNKNIHRRNKTKNKIQGNFTIFFSPARNVANKRFQLDH